MSKINGKRIIIAGGNGFLGRSIAAHLVDGGAHVTILSRSVSNERGQVPHPQIHYSLWDARSLGEWTKILNGSDAIVNLTGRSVNCIKTPDHRDEILRSRVESTQVLGKAMRHIAKPPGVWVQMSTAHIYGDPPNLLCTESSAHGYGFAPNIGHAWESAFEQSKLPEQRSVVLRTSFVIGNDRGAGGGALSTLKLIARLGLGGRVGAGTQGMSWIHETDLNRLVERAIFDEAMKGVYIASSPNPVSQVKFMRALRKVLQMPIGLPAFEWMVRLGAPLFFKTDPELILYGRYVWSERLVAEGFEFQYPELSQALQNLLKR